jgi:hypothetical protein
LAAEERMSYGGHPSPLGPKAQALVQKKEQEREAERAKAALAAEWRAGSGRAGANFAERIRRLLGIGRDRHG